MSFLLSLSPGLSAAVEPVLNSPENGMLNITCEFLSVENSEFSFQPNYIVAMHVIQDFLQGYTDTITLSFELTAYEVIELYRNLVGLRALITIRQVNRLSGPIPEPIFIHEFMAVFTDQHDIYKRINRGLLDDDDNNPVTEQKLAVRFDIQMDLIDPIIYRARKVKISSVLRNVTMMDVLLYVASALGFKNVHIVAPDNTKVYVNFIIPPTFDISTIFEYLQTNDTYGVYDNGIGCYATLGVLYVFPQYETKPIDSAVIKIISVGQDQALGLEGYHLYEGEDTTILSNKGIVDNELLFRGSENRGNSYINHSPDRHIDNWREMDETSFTVSEENIDLYQSVNDVGVENKNYNPVYVETNNPQKLYSELNIIDRTLINLGWTQAVPFTFKPNCLVELHHDNTDGYQVVTGQPFKVAYTYVYVKSHDDLHYIGDATITLVT